MVDMLPVGLGYGLIDLGAAELGMEDVYFPQPTVPEMVSVSAGGGGIGTGQVPVGVHNLLVWIKVERVNDRQVSLYGNADRTIGLNPVLVTSDLLSWRRVPRKKNG